MNKPVFKKMLAWLIIGASLFLIGKHFIANKKDFELFLQINIYTQALLLTLTYIIHHLTTYKIHAILKRTGLDHLSFQDWFKIFSISRLANIYLPQGGNLYRSTVLKKKYNFSYTHSIGLISMLTWLEITLIMLLLTFISLKPTILHEPLEQQSLVLFVITFGIGTFPFLLYKMMLTLLSNKIEGTWIYKRLEAMIKMFLLVITSPPFIIRIISITILIFAFYFFLTYVCFKALNIPITFWAGAIFTAILLFSKSFNIVPGNIGLQEIILGEIAFAAGWGKGEGIVVSTVIRITEYIIILTLSLAVSKSFLTMRRLRQEINSDNSF